MKNGRYILALALLTLFLFGSSRWVPTKEVEPHEQSQTAQAAKKRLNNNSTLLATAAPAKPMPKLAPRLVTLYPSGSISVIKSEPVKKTRPKPKRKVMAPPRNLLKVRPTQKPAAKAPAVSTRRDAEHTVAPASSELTGRRPILEVGYEQIGFDRYVEVMERVGRLYVLVKEGQDVQLGPEVSLARYAAR